MGVYEKLGVKTIINARGCQTMIGGSIMAPQVLEAMAEASRQFCNVTELNRAVGKIIARACGAEAGYCTAGSADGIWLATMAIMTGTDPAKIRRLPDTTGMKNEVIIMRSQRHGYDHAVRAAGAKLVEIGLTTRTFPWELEDAINERTAGVFFTVSTSLKGGFLPLAEVIRIAHARGVPVYVDGASMLPPASNLTKWTGMGADLVIFSGGKGIMGPQSTGLLAGRKDLIEAAAMNGSPYHAMGRPAKVCREEMVGLATAIELYLQRDHQADQERWRKQAEYVAAQVAPLNLPGVKVSVVYDEEDDQLPETFIEIREKQFGASAEQVREIIENGEPRIATGLPQPRMVIVNPHQLQEGEEEIVARRLVEVLSQIKQPARV